MNDQTDTIEKQGAITPTSNIIEAKHALLLHACDTLVSLG